MNFVPSIILYILLSTTAPAWSDQCTEGKNQSPVDLSDDSATPLRVDPLIFYHYDRPLQANLTNNGQTVILNIEPGCELAIAAGGLRGLYQLDEIHFHWVSQHTIDKARLSLEVHFVHHYILYNNISEALEHSQGVAIVAVLFQEVEYESPDFVQILNILEDSTNSDGDITTVKDFLPSALLPANRNLYFRYQGSLITPPCTESVVWTVLAETIPISKFQLEKFHAVNSTTGFLDAYYRPIQRLNERTVYLMRDDLTDDAPPSGRMLYNPLLIILIIPSIVLYIVRFN